jgi:hypothetical protein
MPTEENRKICSGAVPAIGGIDGDVLEGTGRVESRIRMVRLRVEK